MPVDRDIRLWCRSVGDERDPALVIPCCGNEADYARLETEGRRVVYYDVRNRGRSDPVPDLARLGFDAEVTDLAMVFDALGLERASILAPNYHAGVASWFAHSDGDRVERLVLASPIPLRSGVPPNVGAEPSDEVKDHLAQLELDGVPETDPERWCDEWRRAYIPLRMGVPAAFDRLASPCGMPNEQPRSVARTMVCVFAGLSKYDWTPQMRELRVPTLVAHGTADAYPLSAAEEWLETLPDAVLLVMHGVGQYPWVEAPDRFFVNVSSFLDGDELHLTD